MNIDLGLVMSFCIQHKKIGCMNNKSDKLDFNKIKNLF